MIRSDQRNKGGITRFVSRMEKGRWVVLKIRNCTTLEKKYCLDYEEACVARARMIDDYWEGISLN